MLIFARSLGRAAKLQPVHIVKKLPCLSQRILEAQVLSQAHVFLLERSWPVSGIVVPLGAPDPFTRAGPVAAESGCSLHRWPERQDRQCSKQDDSGLNGKSSQ